MAKVQKTIMLPEELYRLVDAVAQSTGANFTKIVIASLIEYLLKDLGQPHPSWMRMAVGLERRDVTLPDIAGTIARDLIREADEALEIRKEGCDAKGLPYGPAEFEHSGAVGKAKIWLERIEKARCEGHDPLAALLRVYTEHNPTL